MNEITNQTTPSGLTDLMADMADRGMAPRPTLYHTVGAWQKTYTKRCVVTNKIVGYIAAARTLGTVYAYTVNGGEVMYIIVTDNGDTVRAIMVNATEATASGVSRVNPTNWEKTILCGWNPVGFDSLEECGAAIPVPAAWGFYPR